MGIFFLLLISTMVVVNSYRPRVMVLHSYSPKYIWTREVDKGIHRALKGQDWVDVRFHYMATKFHRTKAHFRRAQTRAHQAIAQFKPDIVIAIDDNAQRLVAKEYVGRTDIQIIYAGVNGSIDPYGYTNAPNVTGIVERKPLVALKEVLPLLTNQKIETIRTIYLAEKSHSTRKDAAFLAKFDWSPMTYQGHHRVQTFDAWKKIVESAPEKADFLLVSGYRALRRVAKDPKSVIKPKEIMRWTEKHSKIPVIGLNQFNAADGAAFAIGVSPYEQGETPVKLALEILNKSVPAGEIKDRYPNEYVIAVRKGASERRNLTIPKIFKAFAVATESYFP
ncbi:MAG TPA: hypothetical protein DCS82_11685 [Rhodospirillaceae bacterium]|nr:hypothetical protein [Rhodospirillaceae bacterium]HAT36372.1 hypothetical protein [Rhodospirillaceae bacterium]